MKTLITTLAALTAVATGAQAQINYTGGTFTEDFNNLPSSGTVASPFSATVGVQGDIPGEPQFKGTKAAGNGNTAMPFLVDNGSGNSGALYSYGATNDTERALGTLASAGNVPAFGVELVNSSSESYSGFLLTINSEQWRSSTTTQNRVSFSFSLSGGQTNSGNFLTAPGFTPLTMFDLVGSAPVTTNGPLDGNANAVLLSGTIPVTLDPGQSLFLRWTDVNETGNDAGLALDNFNITGQTAAVPEPSTYAMIAGALGLLVFGQRTRRRAGWRV